MWLCHIVHGRKEQKLLLELHVVGDSVEHLKCHDKDFEV